ncbi:unnamed protein product [Lactuca virosa]|uniref:ATP-dependent DNA helicase n=1 Tax=Lactuca virosa TaxID=75947 RepID=A0AAU9NEG7_9ASTR|nr:unnamed protein product [Lactuca virosa]
MARDCIHSNPHVDYKLRLIGKREQDGRTYNLPTSSEVASLIVGDFCESIEKRDIVVQTSSGLLQRISELHPSYLALQYPLLFPYGDDGYRVDILHRGVTSSSNSKRTTCTMREFFAYRIQDRDHSFSLIVNAKRLFQQFLVDGYTMIESERLYFIRNQQKILRCTSYENLRSQQADGNTDISNVVQRVILPSSFTGGARYMMQNYLDAMSLCKWFGYPDFFITFTCNPKWPEVKRFLKYTSLSPEDRPDILCRLFKIKLDAFIKDLRENEIFGKVQAGSSIKYLFKYINKGPDRATVTMVQSDNDSDNTDAVDEIKEYYDCRYISACEASCRIFKYDVHYRYPAVIRLPFHLPGQQQVVYEADDDIENVLNKPSIVSSMFTGWMKCNEINKEARKLTYVEFPTKFVWKSNLLIWKPREIGYTIGRIHSVSPKLGEAYFLRILLNKVKGPKSFEEIRTVNGEICSTFKDACYNLGLLDDDKEYIDAIKEASLSGSGFYLRFLFATMLLSNSLSKPEIVWENTWDILSGGILYNQQQRLKSPGLSLNEDQLKNLTLFEIEQILLPNNSNLKIYTRMPYPDVDSVSSANNRLISEELDYDIPILKNEFDRLFLALTNEQRNIFLDIMGAVKDNKGGVFFVYGYGGTGKTFLWKTISTAIRAQREIVLNVASSGIASLLLTGGRTTHSRFIIPLTLNEDFVCRIDPDSDLASLVRKTSLIIWDEAPMSLNWEQGFSLKYSVESILLYCQIIDLVTASHLSRDVKEGKRERI